MKTKEELSALKEEVETLNKKLRALTEEELAQVTGGRFKEEDINQINILHDYFLERYPDKSTGINYLFSLLESDTHEFSYSDVLNMLATIVIH